MRVLSAFVGGHEISVHNNWWNGVETVKYNGATVSSQFSWFGSVHTFSVEEAGEVARYEVEVSLSLNGISANIWRNEQPVVLGIPRRA